VCADFHDTAAVGTQHGLGLRGKHYRRECRRAHAPAEEQAVTVAHLPGRDRPAIPAEPFGPLPITFAQGL
jgi:hypothetical protein